MKNFLSVADAGDINALVNKALEIKASPFTNKTLGADKKMGIIFLNPSLRTRMSTQIAASNLGLESIVFNADKDGWALEFADVRMDGTKVEHIRDAAPVLGEYFDIIGLRTFPGLVDRDLDYSEFVLNQFIKYTGKPVVSLESATLHPLQSFADAIAIKEVAAERQIKKPKVVLTWAPHIKALPQCVANSFSEWMKDWNAVDFCIAHPAGYALDKKFTGNSRIFHDQDEALANADFVYVKNWSSFENYGQMPEVNGDWMLTLDKLQKTNNAAVMHCLPVRRDLELSSEVLDSAHSIVTRQAGNRVWSAQAVISEILRS